MMNRHAKAFHHSPARMGSRFMWVAVVDGLGGMVMVVICRDCERPMAVLRTTASAAMTVRSHLCECGLRWESIEKISRRPCWLPVAHRISRRQSTDSPPVSHGQHTGSVRGGRGGSVFRSQFRSFSGHFRTFGAIRIFSWE